MTLPVSKSRPVHSCISAGYMHLAKYFRDDTISLSQLLHETINNNIYNQLHI